MIIGVGLDIIDLLDFQNTIERSGEPFLQRVFTTQEREYCQSQPHPLQSFAARFAAKEAAMKAAGIAGDEGLSWKDFEVLLSPSGSPRMQVHGYAASRLPEKGVSDLQISLSHSLSSAVAVAIAIRQSDSPTINEATS